MNIFVTGATGFIGKNFLEKLLFKVSAEDKIFVLVRKGGNFKDERVIELTGSLEEMERFKDQILSCDYFFHLAANPVFSNRFDYEKLNHAPTANIVDILKNSRVLKNFIFISSIGAVDRAANDDCLRPLTSGSEPSPTSRYGQSKLKSEKYILAGGIPYTIIRPAWVYGRDMRLHSHINEFVTQVFGKRIISRFGFPGKVSLIHVDDLSGALVNCIDNASVINHVYFAATEALSIGMIFKIIYKKINKVDVRQIAVPRFSFIFKKIHSRIPLILTNLFLDYLYAEIEPFKKDFSVPQPKSFVDYAGDVISTNIYNGYWVITGANSGIGYALAQQLNGLNKKLILIDKNTDQMSAFKDQVIFKCDLSRFDEIEELSLTIRRYKIFCLINNAGIGFKGVFSETSLDNIRKTIDVDVSYPVVFTKLLLDHLKWCGSVIVNISSHIACNPLPGMSVYAASKAFLSSWSQAIAQELKCTNKVITIIPSGAYTNFQKNAGVRVQDKGRGLLSAEYIARRVIQSVYANKNTVVIGFKANIGIAISKLLPSKWSIYLGGKLFERLR